MSNNENEFGKMLTELRKKKGLTQSELAKEIFVSDKAISRWERGDTLPSLERVYQLSKFFNIDFNKLMVVRTEVDGENSEITDNIIKEFKELEKKHKRFVKKSLITFSSIILFLIVFILFRNTYNRFDVYKIYYSDDNLRTSYGAYIETRIRDELYLGDIKFKYLNKEDITFSTITLYYVDNDKENVLQTYDSLDNIYFVGHRDYIKTNNLSDYFDNLYLKVNVTTNVDSYEYNIKLEFVKDFSNNKIYYKYESFEESQPQETFLNKNIEEVLLSNGFIDVNKNYYKKDLENIFINYTIYTNKLEINVYENDLTYIIKYIIEKNIIEVEVLNNNQTVIESYEYDKNNDNLICKIGSCSDLDYVIKVIDDNFMNLFK